MVRFEDYWPEKCGVIKARLLQLGFVGALGVLTSEFDFGTQELPDRAGPTVEGLFGQLESFQPEKKCLATKTGSQANLPHHEHCIGAHHFTTISSKAVLHRSVITSFLLSIQLIRRP